MDGSTFRIFGTVIRSFSSGAGRERSNSQLLSLAFSAAFSRSKFNIFVTEGGLLESDLASLVEVTSTSLFGRHYADVLTLDLVCAGSCTQKVARNHFILETWITMPGRTNYSSKFVRIRQNSPEFANMENSRKSEKF